MHTDSYSVYNVAILQTLSDYLTFACRPVACSQLRWCIYLSINVYFGLFLQGFCQRCVVECRYVSEAIKFHKVHFRERALRICPAGYCAPSCFCMTLSISSAMKQMKKCALMRCVSVAAGIGMPSNNAKKQTNRPQRGLVCS